MKSSLPLYIVNALERNQVSDRDIVISSFTDINFDGKYDEQWLIATRTEVFVFDKSFGPEPFMRVPIREIERVRLLNAVGSGFLQGYVQGAWLNFVRFSNRLKYVFDQTLKQLEFLLHGEEVEPFAVTDPQRCEKCGLMLETPGEVCPRCLDHGAALSRMTQLIQPYWRATMLLLGLLLIGIALDLAWPLLTRFLVDYVLATPRPKFQGFYARFSPYDSRTLLMFVVATLAGVHVFRAVINVITAKISSRVGNAMTFDVRAALVNKLEQLGLAYYNRQDTGSLVGRVAYDTDAIQSFISQITSGFVMQFLLVIFSVIMMFSLEPNLALWALMPAPFVIAGAFAYWRYVDPQYQRYWDRSAKQAGLLNGILSGIRVVKAFAKETFELERFNRASNAVRSSKNTLDGIAAVFYPVMAIIFQVGGWIIWYVGGLNVLERNISLGTLIAFFGYLSLFYGPLGNLTNLTTWLTQFSTQMHRIFEVLDAPIAVPESESPLPLEKARGKIEFRDVTFSYTRGAPVLKEINLAFHPGEKIGIVGRSGSGKTSLINLIYRFYDVDSGAILLDDKNIRMLSKDDLRRQISIVLQEPFLFRGTFSENIAYGEGGVSPVDIIEASRAASSHEFVMHHQLAYETPVGERGQELSGGERQRISIARGLLRKAPVLILDEATSAIDSDSELAIQMALDDLLRDRTAIMIAHRLSTLQHCDRIYVIENGEIAEMGSHRELMRLDGHYARWVRVQQGQSYIEMTSEREIIRPVLTENPETGLAPINTYKTRWLKPEFTRLRRGPARELQVEVAGEENYRGVFSLWCFPITFPNRYITLSYHDTEGRTREIGIIENLADWPKESQALVKNALLQHYLFHYVEKVYSVRKFSQFLSVRARTHIGNVDFVLRHSSDSAKNYGANGKMLIDIEDNLYIVPDINALSRTERDTFERYIYW